MYFVRSVCVVLFFAVLVALEPTLSGPQRVKVDLSSTRCLAVYMSLRNRLVAGPAEVVLCWQVVRKSQCTSYSGSDIAHENAP